MKKLLLMVCMMLGIVLFCNTAWANFYVVAAGKRAKKTVLVSPKSTSIESGTALLNALSKITDASEANPYLIIIEPGVYNIGSSSLQMKSYVNIQGSGENVTKITGNINSSTSGVVVGRSDVEIRFLTVENSGGGHYSIGIYNNYASPVMNHVTVRASGTEINYGVFNDLDSYPIMTHAVVTASNGSLNVGIFNFRGSSPTMTHMHVSAYNGGSNIGVKNRDFGSPTMVHVTVTSFNGSIANHGVVNTDNSGPTLYHSKITGTTLAIDIDGSSTTYINNTILNGGVGGDGDLVAYEETFHGHIIVKDDIQVEGPGGWNSSGDEAIIGLGNVPGQFYMKAVWGDGIKFGAYAAADALVLKQSTGNVGIGTPIPSEKLEVNGNIKATNLILTTGTPPWSDYVFDDDYNLLPLQDVKKFISKNKHLPDIPSAQEVAQNGINIGESQTLLLKKVEELTLHLINMDDMMNSMNKEMSSMQKTINHLEQENKMLTQ